MTTDEINAVLFAPEGSRIAARCKRCDVKVVSRRYALAHCPICGGEMKIRVKPKKEETEE